MGTPVLFLGVGWKFKIHVIGNNASNQLEITKSPCNESNLTVLKLCVAFVTVPTNNSLWVGRFEFLFKHLTGPPATPEILHATALVVWTHENREDQLYLETLFSRLCNYDMVHQRLQHIRIDFFGTMFSVTVLSPQEYPKESNLCPLTNCVIKKLQESQKLLIQPTGKNEKKTHETSGPTANFHIYF